MRGAGLMLPEPAAALPLGSPVTLTVDQRDRHETR